MYSECYLYMLYIPSSVSRLIARGNGQTSRFQKNTRTKKYRNVLRSTQKYREVRRGIKKNVVPSIDFYSKLGKKVF